MKKFFAKIIHTLTSVYNNNLPYPQRKTYSVFGIFLKDYIIFNKYKYLHKILK